MSLSFSIPFTTYYFPPFAVSLQLTLCFPQISFSFSDSDPDVLSLPHFSHLPPGVTRPPGSTAALLRDLGIMGKRKRKFSFTASTSTQESESHNSYFHLPSSVLHQRYKMQAAPNIHTMATWHQLPGYSAPSTPDKAFCSLCQAVLGGQRDISTPNYTASTRRNKKA